MCRNTATLPQVHIGWTEGRLGGWLGLAVDRNWTMRGLQGSWMGSRTGQVGQILYSLTVYSQTWMNMDMPYGMNISPFDHDIQQSSLNFISRGVWIIGDFNEKIILFIMQYHNNCYLEIMLALVIKLFCEKWNDNLANRTIYTIT